MRPLGVLYIERAGRAYRYDWINALHKIDGRTLCVLLRGSTEWLTLHNIEAAKVLSQ